MENIYGQKIKELRNELRKTQADFSVMIGCTQAALSTYESGNTIPSLDTLISVAKNCNVSLDWLCGLSPNKKNDGNVKTFADSMKLFKKVLDSTPTFEITDYSDGTMSVNFIDSPYIEFLNGYKKMYESLKEGLIDQEILDLWTEKTLKKYDDILIVDYINKTFVSEQDDIPF